MPDLRRKKRVPYTMRKVMNTSSTAMYQMEKILLADGSTTAERIRAASVISALSGTYKQVKETADLEERISKLESQ